jgi:hypothetical protein
VVTSGFSVPGKKGSNPEGGDGGMRLACPLGTAAVTDGPHSRQRLKISKLKTKCRIVCYDQSGQGQYKTVLQTELLS